MFAEISFNCLLSHAIELGCLFNFFIDFVFITFLDGFPHSMHVMALGVR